jgi:hypothetical protein
VATDLPWNGSVRRKAPEEGLGGIVSGVSVKAGTPSRPAVTPSAPSQGVGGPVQGAKIEATPMEPKPSGPPSRPNGRLKIPTS